MDYKKITYSALVGALILSGFGCNKNNRDLGQEPQLPIERTINGFNYKFEDGRVTEIDSDDDKEATYGVISDIHGEIEKAKYFAEQFLERGVDGIIIPGDISLNEPLRYGREDSRDDKDEIIGVLEVIAETGLPIFVIPGNHERVQDYRSALEELSEKYSNIIDMTKYRVFDGDDIDFISLPGYQTRSIPGRVFIPDDGYWASKDFIFETGKLAKELDDPIILITHGAGKTNARSGPSTLYDGTDVGDLNTTEMQKNSNIPFAIVGHIHEAGGTAAAFDGSSVKPNELSEQFTVNFGTLENWKYLDGKTYDGMAGIFTLKGNQAKYEILTYPR